MGNAAPRNKLDGREHGASQIGARVAKLIERSKLPCVRYAEAEIYVQVRGRQGEGLDLGGKLEGGGQPTSFSTG